jgi:DNA-binding response OmpR family regulator
MIPPILLVEDNAQDEKLIFRALRKANIANVIDVARDGQQALDYLFRSGEFAHLAGSTWPSVVLLDINLPKVNGLDVLTKLRNNEPTRLLPVVVLTSSDDERDRMQGYRNGANSFVRKPIDLGEFVEAVASLGIYWAVTNDPPFRSSIA